MVSALVFKFTMSNDRLCSFIAGSTLSEGINEITAPLIVVNEVMLYLIRDKDQVQVKILMNKRGSSLCLGYFSTLVKISYSSSR
jgi:hypothetical protein